jgi:hypothetical protein
MVHSDTARSYFSFEDTPCPNLSTSKTGDRKGMKFKYVGLANCGKFSKIIAARRICLN